MERWEELAAEWAEPLTAALRATGGAQSLRGVQAAALIDLIRNRGLFLQGRIGCGKSLFLGLAPAVLGAERPLLLTSGGLKKSLRDEIARARAHWQISTGLVIESYQKISRMPAAGGALTDFWGGLGPTLIACDEAHWLANVGTSGAAVANLINDWMVAHPETTFVAATGTADLKGLTDYAHLVEWALRGKSPLPARGTELELWSRIIDGGDDSVPADVAWVAQQLAARAPTIASCREAYRALLRATPGIIIKDDPFRGVPLTITLQRPALGSEDLHAHLGVLREYHQRPDGVEVVDPLSDEALAPGATAPDRVEGPIWRVARRMARGLCYAYRPPPPASWREARRMYGRAVRAAIAAGEAYTEAQVRQAAEAAPDSLTGLALAAWRRESLAFGTPNEVTLWLDYAAVDWAIEWGGSRPGLIFVDDRAFAAELARRTQWPHYAEMGRSADGSYIEDEPRAPRERTVIASRHANGTGRNLQHHWARMLFVTSPSSAAQLEQNVGRLMREGQTRPVSVDVLTICPEDFGAHQSILTGAQRTSESFSDLALNYAVFNQ